MSAVGRVVHRALLVLSCCGALAGCGKGSQVGNQNQNTNTNTTNTGAGLDCKGALQGQTYAVCGRLSTAPSPVTSGTTTVLGNADAGASGQGSTYVIEGGTFHAGR